MALSRSFVRSSSRARNSFAAPRPFGVLVKKRNSLGSRRVSSPRAVADDLEHARGELAAIDTRLSALERERHRMRWYERAARRELERRMENWEHPREHWLSE